MHFSAAVLGKTVLTAVVGFVVGVCGTIMHRSVQPWGLVVSLGLVLTVATTARAFGGLVAWIGFVVGLGATVLALSQAGPGGDVLMPSDARIGLAWLLGSVAVAVVAMLLPRSWFSDAPRPARRSSSAVLVATDAAGESDSPQ